MAKAKIEIKGTAEKPPKVNTDGTVDLLFKASMAKDVPKGLKSLGDSFCVVHIGPKTWKKVSSQVKDDSTFIIVGEPKANNNSKGTPFMEVVAFDISLRPDPKAFPLDPEPKKEKQIKKPDPDPGAPVKNSEPDNIKQTKKVYTVQDAVSINDIVIPEKFNNKELGPEYGELLEKAKTTGVIMPLIVEKETMALVDGYKRYCIAKELNMEKVPIKYAKENKANIEINPEWFKPEEVIDLETNKIILLENLHLSTSNLDFRGKLKKVKEGGKLSPVAVRELEDGRYALVMGLLSYIMAKTLDIEKVPAIVRNMSNKELLNQIKIKKL